MDEDDLVRNEDAVGISPSKDESRLEDRVNLTYLAQDCAKHLQNLSDEEESHVHDVTTDRYWASRQLAEYNVWCSNIGIHGEGTRSIDMRLRDVPEIQKLLAGLMRSLQNDLHELRSASPNTMPELDEEVSPDDNDSDASSLSFESLSSSNASVEQHPADDHGLSQEENVSLKLHVGDTIDRLQELAKQIQRAGAQYRRQRVDLYREKEQPRQVFEGLTRLGRWKVDHTFELASEEIRKRTAESFARRRIRFEYLKAHQKKLVAQNPAPKPQPTTALVTVPEGAEIGPVSIQQKAIPKTHHGAVAPYPDDQKTIFSATMNTQFNFRTELKMKQQPESVRSVAIRSTGFPPPPQTKNGSFQCPYCRVTFSAREADPGRWSQHVMQDFEPYFCTFETCTTPFDVPNSFDGLLEHMQAHVPVRLHVEKSNGDHSEMLDEEFEEHIESLGKISPELMINLKDDSRRRGAFLFEACPFCGGYPDVLEKRFPDSGTIEAQNELRRHIKQHMQEITLFLPPYRSDIVDDDNNEKGSDLAERQSTQDDIPESLDQFVSLDPQADSNSRNTEETLVEVDSTTNDTGFSDNFWTDLFNNGAVYNRSTGSKQDIWTDAHLRSFIARAVETLSTENDNHDWFVELVSRESSDIPLLFLAATYEEETQSIAVLAQLLRMGADIETKDRNNQTLLAYSIYEELTHIAIELCDHGVDIESRDHEGRTPLAVAAMTDRLGFVEFFLEYGANMESRDFGGRTPLALAVEQNNLAAVEALVEGGADVNASDNRGARPLLNARYNGFDIVADFLMGKGAVLTKQVGIFDLVEQEASEEPASLSRLPGASERKVEPNDGTVSTPFQAITEEDSTNRTQQYQTITLQQPYLNYSLEELRVADYNQGRRYRSTFSQSNNNTVTSAIGCNTASFGNNNTTLETLQGLEKAEIVPFKPPLSQDQPLEEAHTERETAARLTPEGSECRKTSVLHTYSDNKLGETDLGYDPAIFNPQSPLLRFSQMTVPLDSGEAPHDNQKKPKEAEMVTRSLENGWHMKVKSIYELPLQIGSELGRGGLTMVYHARSKLTLKNYALKCLAMPKRTSLRKEDIDALLSERRTVQRLRHRHIIRVLGSYESEKERSVGLLISPVAERDLAQFLRTNSKDDKFKTTLKTFFGCLATALHYLHSASVRHNDINPSNILVLNQTVLISGFGAVVDCKPQPGYVENPNAFVYTRRYAPPEVVLQPLVIGDYSSDVWSLGCVFFEMTAALQDVGADELRSLCSSPENSTGGNYFQNRGKTEQLLNSWKQAMGQSGWLVQLIERMFELEPQRRPVTTTIMQTINDRSQRTSEWRGSCCEPLDLALLEHEVVTPDKIRWFYRDQSGLSLGPFSGLEMDEWYRRGWFDPEQLIRRYGDTDYTTLAQLIRRVGNSSDPFLVPQVGISHDTPPTALRDLPVPIFERPSAPKLGRSSEIHISEHESQSILPSSQDERENSTKFGIHGLARAITNKIGIVPELKTTVMCMGIFDREFTGFLLEDNVQTVLSFVSAWCDLFDRFVQTSGTKGLSRDGFSQALSAFGYRVSEDFLRLLFNTFADSAEGKLSFDRFAQACATLRRGTDLFKRFDDDRDGYVTIGFEECLDSMLRMDRFEAAARLPERIQALWSSSQPEKQSTTPLFNAMLSEFFATKTPNIPTDPATGGASSPSSSSLRPVLEEVTMSNELAE